MEADENEVCRGVIGLKAADFRPVGNDESDLVCAEEIEDGVGEPALVSELDRVPKVSRKRGKGNCEPLVVPLKVGGSCQSSGPSFGVP